ncbi:MAG: hypothetical protein AB8B91_11845 [Rubripirellula sp.]
MNLEFQVDEVMLDGISGCVRGFVETESDQIESVECVSFQFRDDQLDCPALLTETQKAQATEIVERALSSAELTRSGSRMVVSADRYSPASNEGSRVLAEFLSAPREVEHKSTRTNRRAQ